MSKAMKNSAKVKKKNTLYSKSYILNLAKRGFTIVELLVAMGLFVTVVSISTGAFIQMLRSQRIVSALINANANASIALEQISRELRTGTGFVVQPASRIMFVNAQGAAIEYRLNAASSSVERNVGAGPFVPITASDVGVLSMNYIIMCNSAVGCNPNADGYSPRITIILRVTPTNITGFNVPVINLQTTISARELDG